MPWGWGASLGRTSCPYSGRGTSMCHLRPTPRTRRPRAAGSSPLRSEPQARPWRTRCCCLAVAAAGGRGEARRLAWTLDPWERRRCRRNRPRPARFPHGSTPRSGSSRRRGRPGVSQQRPWMAAVASAYMDVRPSGCDTPGLPRLPPKPATLPLQQLPLRFQWPLRSRGRKHTPPPHAEYRPKENARRPGGDARRFPARLTQPFSAASTRAVISSMLPTPSIRVSVPRFS